MLSTLLYADSFLGRSLVGRITQGTAKANQVIKAINLKGEKVDEGRLTKIFRYEGTKKVPIEVGEAGDIVVVAGLEKAFSKPATTTISPASPTSIGTFFVPSYLKIFVSLPSSTFSPFRLIALITWLALAVPWVILPTKLLPKKLSA